jgi:hypothetical protein
MGCQSATGRTRYDELGFDVGGKAHDSLGLHGVPAIVVSDRTGKIRLTRESYNSAETSFRRDLVEFLRTL